MYACMYVSVGTGAWFLNDSIFADIIDYDEFLTVRSFHFPGQLYPSLSKTYTCKYVCMYVCVAKAQRRAFHESASAADKAVLHPSHGGSFGWLVLPGIPATAQLRDTAAER